MSGQRNPLLEGFVPFYVVPLVIRRPLPMPMPLPMPALPPREQSNIIRHKSADSEYIAVIDPVKHLRPDLPTTASEEEALKRLENLREREARLMEHFEKRKTALKNALRGGPVNAGQPPEEPARWLPDPIARRNEVLERPRSAATHPEPNASRFTGIRPPPMPHQRRQDASAEELWEALNRRIVKKALVLA
jgi:hypothetical protein